MALLSEHCFAPFCFLSEKQKILFSCFSWLKTKVIVILNVSSGTGPPLMEDRC